MANWASASLALGFTAARNSRTRSLARFLSCSSEGFAGRGVGVSDTTISFQRPASARRAKEDRKTGHVLLCSVGSALSRGQAAPFALSPSYYMPTTLLTVLATGAGNQPTDNRGRISRGPRDKCDIGSWRVPIVRSCLTPQCLAKRLDLQHGLVVYQFELL